MTEGELAATAQGGAWPRGRPRGRATTAAARGLALVGAALVALAAPAAARADEAPPQVTPEAARRIAMGLDFLASRQHPEGYWLEHIGHKVNEDYEAHVGRHVGVTSLACIAFLANGSVPGRGRYGDNVQRGLEWVMAQVHPDTGFVEADGSRMYSHGFATLFLAEAYGMSPREELRWKLQLAVDCLVSAQNAQGGWRYLPHAPDADISITVTAVQALRAARNVGIFVPVQTIDRAVDYVKRSQVRFHHDPTIRGAFWYQIDEKPFPISRTSFALTAAGVTALYGAGAYDSTDEIRAGLAYLSRPGNRPPVWRMRQSFDYYYAHYYASQAFFQAGGGLWARWYPSVRDEILGGMKPEGYWEDLVGPIYATSMATIILQIPYNYLPIFER